MSVHLARRSGLMSDELKYELAEEMGFAHKVKDGDWGNITTREAGSLVRAAILRAERQLARRQGWQASADLPAD